MITFFCEHCRQSLEARPALLGQEIRCTQCRRPVRVPRDDSSSSQSPAPATVYRAGTALHFLHLVVGGGFCLLSLAGAISLLFLLPKSSMQEWLAGLGLLLFSLAVYALWMFVVVLPALDDLGLQVEVLPEGLRLLRRGAPQHVAWDDIRAVWQDCRRVHLYGIPLFHTDRYTLRLQAGGKIAFNEHVAEVAALGNAIQREVTARLLPRAIEACDAGRTIAFGALRAAQRGVSRGTGGTLDWDQVSEISVAEGYLSIKRSVNLLVWARVAVRSVPNVYLLFALAEHYQAGRQ